jgi:hypothetical protein
MVGPLQLNVRINAECHEALERYRSKYETAVRETLPEFRLTLTEAFRIIVAGALKVEEQKKKKT